VPRVRRFNINRTYFARDIVRRIDAKIARVNLYDAASTRRRRRLRD